MDEKIENVKKELEETTKELEKEIAKLRDPTVHAAVMYAILRERENTNRILKNLLAKLDRIEAKLSARETRSEVTKRDVDLRFLPSVDRKIISFIKSRGPTTAEAVRKYLRYKGRNAACVRLNRLHQIGLLEKKRVGKEIYYHAAHLESEANEAEGEA